jgi:yecA family protein
MTTKIRRLEFDEICDLFVSLGAHNSPSEMHGLLAGQLSAGKRMDYSEWLKEAKEFIDTDSAFSKDEEEVLQFVYMSTLTALADDELGFYPLLPDDEADIEQRLHCLGLWCQGYMAGFALVEKAIAELPEIVNDALNDLAAIAQVGINESEDWDESADEDYFQIVEYVRLAAMNIFVEYAVDEAEQVQSDMQEKGDEYLSAQSLFKKRQLH